MDLCVCIRMQISTVLRIQPHRQDVGIRKIVKTVSSCVGGTRYRRGPAGVDTRKYWEKMASGCCSGASSCGKYVCVWKRNMLDLNGLVFLVVIIISSSSIEFDLCVQSDFHGADVQDDVCEC